MWNMKESNVPPLQSDVDSSQRLLRPFWPHVGELELHIATGPAQWIGRYLEKKV
jgi:hypothetical protein